MSSANRYGKRAARRRAWRSLRTGSQNGPFAVTRAYLKHGPLSAAFLAQQRPSASSAYSFENLITQGGIALIELLLGAADCVRHVRYQANRESSRGGKGKQRGGLHLHGQGPGFGVECELLWLICRMSTSRRSKPRLKPGAVLARPRTGSGCNLWRTYCFQKRLRERLGRRHLRIRRVGPGNFTPSPSQIRT